jgi:L-aspartate oxidase
VTAVPLRRLPAALPRWELAADVVVAGSGAAGISAALAAAAHGRRVLLLSKGELGGGATPLAQGGMAAAIGPDDDVSLHRSDTIAAGAGLCDPAAAGALVAAAPAEITRLAGLGAQLDRSGLGLEGGHSRRRIIHAGGDATGAEVHRVLVAALLASQVEVLTGMVVLDALRDARGQVGGLAVGMVDPGGGPLRPGIVTARAVVVATGGFGQAFAATTSPAGVTGDGLALAARAGAELADLEFVQFHPTVLWLGPDAEGQQPLVSEAVRGEGAHLVDADGVRFMVGQHELAELAPRDVVAKGIMRRMQETGADHMLLDARHFGAQMWQERFPTILAACRAHGIDPVTQPIPVAPAAHYASGGVRTDLHGRTTVPGLYACGEVACTGVHGANRLASNSLLEGLVFAERIAADIVAHPASPGAPVLPEASDAFHGGPLLAPEARYEVQRIMAAGAGVLRSAESLAVAAGALERLHTAAVEAYDRDGKTEEPCVETWEATNLSLVARVLVAAARRREETRGCHWREDRPDRDDAQWRRHLVVRLTPHRTLEVRTTQGPDFGGTSPAGIGDDGAAAPHPAPATPKEFS